jgi:hypothetical protein
MASRQNAWNNKETLLALQLKQSGLTGKQIAVILNKNMHGKNLVRNDSSLSVKFSELKRKHGGNLDIALHSYLLGNMLSGHETQDEFVDNLRSSNARVSDVIASKTRLIYDYLSSQADLIKNLDKYGSNQDVKKSLEIRKLLEQFDNKPKGADRLLKTFESYTPLTDRVLVIGAFKGDSKYSTSFLMPVHDRVFGTKITPMSGLYSAIVNAIRFQTEDKATISRFGRLVKLDYESNGFDLEEIAIKANTILKNEDSQLRVRTERDNARNYNFGMKL